VARAAVDDPSVTAASNQGADAMACTPLGRPARGEEVADAVAYYVGTSPLRFATADGVADQAASQVLGGLPPDYLDTSLAALREVTPESATAAYTSVVDAGTASLVVVGAADQLAEPLRALGYDDLVVTEG
jgi:predicted Zn-dependent peptidase